MINIAARIRDRGEYVRPGVKKGIGVYKVRCQGCGEYIFSDSSMKDIEYVKTKRGTEMFFHGRCVNEIWKRKMVGSVK